MKFEKIGEENWRFKTETGFHLEIEKSLQGDYVVKLQSLNVAEFPTLATAKQSCIRLHNAIMEEKMQGATARMPRQ
jgi:hypothetical protein